MQVLGLGNVTGCNRSYVFINNGGKQDSIRSTPDLLSTIRDTASRDYVFYTRMWEVLTDEYEKRKAEVHKLYHFITDDMVGEAFIRDYKEGLSLSCRKESNNEECIRQFSRLYGLYDGANLASDKRWEARKIYIQADNSLNEK